jgi:integrase
VAQRRDGEKVHYLERMVDGRRVSIALEMGEKKAEGELALFNRDPATYLRERHERLASVLSGVVVDVATIDAFLSWLKAEGRSLAYRRNLHTYLSEWCERLDGADLRALSTAQLLAMLGKWDTGRKHRIIALKSLCSYLRTNRAILPTNADPTLALKVPPPRPEKATRAKGYEIAHVERIYAAIGAQDVRDVLCLRAKSGMHETEVERLAAGQGALVRVKDGGEIAGTATFVHKSGRVHIQSLDAQAFAAAQRVVAYGVRLRAEDRARGHSGRLRHIDNARQHREIQRAAERLTALARAADPAAEAVKVIAPGELRHSFVTWGRTVGRVVRVAAGGLPLALLAEVVGHQSTRTTSRYYDGTEIPPMVALPIHLVHPDDPPIPSAESPRGSETAARDGAAPAPARPAGKRPRTPRPRSGRATRP